VGRAVRGLVWMVLVMTMTFAGLLAFIPAGAATAAPSGAGCAASDCVSGTVQVGANTAPYDVLLPSAPSNSVCPASDCVRGNVQVEGETVPFDVLLPPGYENSTARYPVVYLLHGGFMNQDTWLQYSDIASFTRALPPDQQAIVVMPYGGTVGFYMNWLNGANYYETADVDILVPYIDHYFRTIADRADRVIAGLSMGGYAAMMYAARHPDLFVAAASFSGADALSDPTWQAILTGLIPSVSAGCEVFAGNRLCASAVGPIFGPSNTPSSSASLQPNIANLPDVTGITPWGDPVTDQVWWRDYDPVSLASNLHGVSLSLFSGTGVPCDAADVSLPEATAPVEALMHEQNVEFNAALTAASVPHFTDISDCGVHSWQYWNRDLQEWWPQMIKALGTPAPSKFDFRSADPVFSAWGWTFRAEPNRAPEFLSIQDASRQGATFAGSGIATVTTGPYFLPGQIVQLSGAVTRSATADRNGRITFQVDLGPPHKDQQFTVQQLLMQADTSSYWITRSVQFSAE
jgi:S-formylglutathione hydrolase FrmB